MSTIPFSVKETIKNRDSTSTEVGSQIDNTFQWQTFFPFTNSAGYDESSTKMRAM